MSERPLTELFGATTDTQLDESYVNNLLAELESRISALQVLKDGLEAAIAQSEQIALDRINETVTPAVLLANQQLATLVGLLETAEADLAAAATDALSQIQPQIDAKLAEATTAITNAEAATSAAATAAAEATAAKTDLEAVARRVAIRMVFGLR